MKNRSPKPKFGTPILKHGFGILHEGLCKNCKLEGARGLQRSRKRRPTGFYFQAVLASRAPDADSKTQIKSSEPKGKQKSEAQVRNANPQARFLEFARGPLQELQIGRGEGLAKIKKATANRILFSGCTCIASPRHRFQNPAPEF